MRPIMTDRIGAHIISDTTQDLQSFIMPGFCKLETDDTKLVLVELGKDPVNVEISKDDLSKLIDASTDGNNYIINIVRKAKWVKDTKVNSCITMHDIEVVYSLYSIEMITAPSVTMNQFLDNSKSESHILTVEAVFNTHRLNGAKIDTVVKFKNMNKFYLLHESMKPDYDPGFKAGDVLANVTLVPIRDGAEVTSEGVITYNISKRYPAIIKYAGMAIYSQISIIKGRP